MGHIKCTGDDSCVGCRIAGVVAKLQDAANTPPRIVVDSLRDPVPGVTWPGGRIELVPSGKGYRSVNKDEYKDEQTRRKVLRSNTYGRRHNGADR